MPNRIIREGWLESERINLLDAPSERFFLRLCLRADDFGRYHANPVLLRSNLFPLREDIRGTDIPRWLASCETAGLLRCYVIDGKRYLEIPRFEQRTRALASKFPQPPPADSLTADTCQSYDGHPRTYAETETETETETDIVRPTQPSPLPADAGQPTVSDIYDAYPRKEAKQAALKAIEKAVKAIAPRSAEWLLKATRDYAAAVALWSSSERQFIPHAATWFNRASYDDDREAWKRQTRNEGRTFGFAQ